MRVAACRSGINRSGGLGDGSDNHGGMTIVTDDGWISAIAMMRCERL